MPVGTGSWGQAEWYKGATQAVHRWMPVRVRHLGLYANGNREPVEVVRVAQTVSPERRAQMEEMGQESPRDGWGRTGQGWGSPQVSPWDDMALY